MNCPRCETKTLVTHQRGGMAIEICKNCRGVWLDQGELERLALTPPAPAADQPVDDIDSDSIREADRGDRNDNRDDDDDDRDDDDDDRRKRPKKSKRPKSFGSRVADVFEDIFDELFD